MILVPSGVSVKVYKRYISIKGSLGTLYLSLKTCSPSTWKLHLAMLNNILVGVSQGYIKKLQINGSGYRVSSITETSLILKLGYSHDVTIAIPKGIVVQTNKYNQILCIGIDKQVLSQFSKSIEKARPYNIYKKKGIFPAGGNLPMKLAGKPGLV